MLNNTIEERVSLLEVQVADLREDVTVVQGGVVDLDEDVNFLFDETVIQDERLFSLEQTTDAINAELVSVDDELEGKEMLNYICTQKYSHDWDNYVTPLNVIIAGLQDTTLDLDSRVTVLEENGGSDGNSSVAELEVRVEELEGTAADHETRLTTTETDIEGRIIS